MPTGRQSDLALKFLASAYPVGSGCGVGPAGDLVVGRGWMLGTESEQCLEGGHRRAASVVAEDELVEVDLEVGVADAAVGAVHPRLEVGDRAVGTGQVGLRSGRCGPLAARAMVIAGPGKAVVAPPAIGADDRPRRRRGLHERGQGRLGGVGEHLQAKSPRAPATNLDRDPAQRLGAALAPAPEPLLLAAEEELVDLDL